MSKGKGVNKVTLIGNLGQDPATEWHNELCICKISVATTESWKDKTGKQRDKTEWHNVTFFGHLALIADKYLKRGYKVYIEGKNETSHFEKDGVKQQRTIVIAHEMQMLDSLAIATAIKEKRSDSNNTAHQRQPNNQPESFDNDIAF